MKSVILEVSSKMFHHAYKGIFPKICNPVWHQVSCGVRYGVKKQVPLIDQLLTLQILEQFVPKVYDQIQLHILRTNS